MNHPRLQFPFVAAVLAACLAFLAVAPTARAAEAQALVGQRAVISVTVESGTQPFTYQWMKDGKDIPGATAATYAIAKVTAADAGNYTVKVTNTAGSTVSDTAALTIVVPPGRSTTRLDISSAATLTTTLP